MFNIEYIRNHKDEYLVNIKKRGLNINLDSILKLHDEKLEIQKIFDDIQKKRNDIANKIKTDLSSKDKLSQEGKDLKIKSLKIQEELQTKSDLLYRKLLELPNLISDDMPEGIDESGNIEVKKVGKIPKFDFQILDHIELGIRNDLIDIDKSAKVSGSRFYYLKNDLVLLQFALFNFVLSKLISKGFTPIIPPELVKERALFGTGYFPLEEDQIYKLESKNIEDKNNLYLIGTSEVPLISYHQDEILDEKDLPIRYIGISHCFRSEVGSWGKDVKGIKRVHQFEKIEMVVFSNEDDSYSIQEELLSIEEEILNDLNLPYHVLNMCTGDVSMQTYKKYDVEVYVPSVNEYVEVMSNTNTIDYQSRRLNIRYKDKENGKIKFVHTLNATGITNTRPLIAIMENFQTKDGRIKVPDVLVSFMGNKEFIGENI